MLDYSGTLLHGMRQMGLDDVFDALGYLTHDAGPARPSSGSVPPGATRSPRRRRSRITGCTCGPGSTISPPSSAWRRSGAIRGFSPAEMALPNHPDVAYEFVRTLR